MTFNYSNIYKFLIQNVEFIGYKKEIKLKVYFTYAYS
jgi:hypothetical protein